MAHHPLPLNELAVAVQNAVEQALAKHGAVPIDKLWVGFVAPDAIATHELANKVTSTLSKEAGIHAQPSLLATTPVAGGAAHAEALVRPGHIIGLIYAPPTVKR